MLDSLIQYLLEEVAMDGDAGTDVLRLNTFINDYFNPPLSTTTAGISLPSRQNNDQAFLSFVWDTLIELKDINVGVLRRIADLPKSTLAPESEETKPKAKGKKALAPPLTHKFEFVDADEKRMGRDALVDKYGDDLRIAVSPEEVWAAITGSHARPSSVTPKVYEVLQYVSRGKGDGATVVQIGKDLGIDQRSAFHFVRVAISIGAVKKFRVTEGGAWTNRILHVRYLDVSPHWAIHIATDGPDDSDGGADNSEDEEAPQSTRVTAISRSHLSVNPDLVRGRILRALKAASNQTLPHVDIASTIGLFTHTKPDLRRLNTIIQGLCVENKIERVLLQHASRKTEISSLRLVENANTDDKAQGAPTVDLAEDDTSYASAIVPIDRQILDLLVEADMEGMRNIDISVALGGYATRTVDHMLNKLERDPPPPHLADFQVRSVIETFGREKRTRWFLLTAFLRRCTRDGIPETDPEYAELESDAVGGWSQLETSGFYRDPEAYEKWLSSVDISASAGTTGKKPKGPPKSKKDKVVKEKKDKVAKAKKDKVVKAEVGSEGETEDLKGKGKASQQDDSSSEEEVEVKKPCKTPVPRPQKPGPITYYERRKREEVERVRLGLPPKSKRDSALGGRRSKAAIAEAEAEKQLAIANGTWVEPLPRRKRSRKSAANESEVDELKSESEALDGEQRGSSMASSSRAYRPPPSPPSAQPSEASTSRRTTRGIDVGGAAPLPLPTSSPHQPIDSTPQLIDSTSQPIASSPRPAASSRASPAKSSPQKRQLVLEIIVKRGRGRPRKDGSAPRPSQPTPLAAASQFPPPQPTSVAISPVVVEKEAIQPDEPGVADVASPHLEPDLSPPPPPRRGRGRPRKDGTTGSSPQPVPAKASTTAGPAASLAARKRGLALEPHDEPTVSPRAKRTRQGAAAAVVEQPIAEPAGEEQAVAGPAPPDSPMEEDVPEVPVVNASAQAGAADDDGEDDAAIQVDASASTSQLAPSPPAAKAPRPKRATASSRPNLTAVKRQQDILAYIEHSGGIVDFAPRLNEYVSEFLKARDPTGPVFTMDRRICEQAVDGLLKRDACRLTVTHGDQGRREVLSLPTIALDGPEMTAFLKSETTRGAPSKRAKDLPLAGNVDEEKPPVAREPEWTDDSETVRAYFEQDNLVAGARYGCYYGRFARARELHQFLVDFVNTHPTSPYVVPHDAGSPSVVKSSILVTAIPLDIYLRIMPLPQVSERLDKFLADPANRSRPLEDLPQWAHRLIAPSVPRMRKAMTSTLRCLVELLLVKPLSEKPGQDGTLEETASKEFFASYLRISPTAPIYAFSQPTRPLRAVLPIRNSDDARQYWDELHKASLPNQDNRGSVETMDLATSNFPPVFRGSVSIGRLITSTTKWHDEYMLILNQRRYLASVLEARDYVLFDETPEERAELQQLADSVLAPIAVVEEYLRQVRERGGPKPSMSQKRRKLEASGDASGSDTPTRTGKKSEAGIPIAPKRDVKASLEHKAMEAASQRERDFHSIVDHFGKERGRPVYEQTVLDFLLKRFCRRYGSSLDSKSLENELRILVGSDDLDPGYKTIVPGSIHSKVAVANDPYALPRRAQVKKAGGHHARPKVPRAPAVASSGTQSEFLSAPPRQVPVLGDKQRLPRNFFSAEQDDLFLDAGAILKARAKHTGLRILWAVLEPLFEGIVADKCRQHYSRLTSKKEEQLYSDRLVDAWTQAWNVKRGTAELPDPNPNSMVEFDIFPFIRCLRANIDKTSLRLAGPANAPEAQMKVNPLPSPITSLEQDNHVVWTAGCTDLSSRWNAYWKPALGSFQRDTEAAAMPFSCPAQAVPDPPLDREFCKAISAFKMVVVTPEAVYTEASGHAFLAPFEAVLETVVEKLNSLSMITTQEKELARRGPGRAYVLSDKYLMSFEEVVSPARLRAAERVESRLADEDAEDVWPLIVDDGDMMALVRMVSEGMVDLTVEPPTSSQLRNSDNYETRKINDEVLEGTVNVSLIDPGCYVPTELSSQKPSATPPQDSTDDPTMLDVALAVVLSGETDLEAEAIRAVDAALREAGSAGLSTAALKETSSPEFASEAALTLVSSSPPLAFWAGDSVPVLVSSQFFSSWTVLVTPSEAAASPAASTAVKSKKSAKGKIKAKEVDEVAAMDVDGEVPVVEGERRMIFPALWLDVNGDVVQLLWDKSAGWIKGVLLAHAGATCHQIYLRAKTTEILTLMEIMLALTTLEEHGVVERRAVEGEDVDWDEARWFLRRKWYGA